MKISYRVPQRLRTRQPRSGSLIVEELESRIVPAALPQPDHVVLVIEENHSYAQIIGAADAPYINALAQQGVLLTAAHGVEHPSQPNYLDLFSGSNQGVRDDARPAGAPFTTPNLGAELRTAGLSFAGYSESMPSVGFDGDSFTTTAGQNQYQRKHNPWSNFTKDPAGVNQLPPSVNQPFTNFPTDFTQLPTVAIVVPNLQHDMHDGTVAQGDSWLQGNLDRYVQWARNHNSLLVVTWDENDSSPGNQIPTFFVGPMVQPGTNAQAVNHFDVLRTIEDLYGLPAAGASAAATPIDTIWAAQVQFGAAAYRVQEGTAAVTIALRRTGSSAGAVSEQYLVAIPESLNAKVKATPGLDFQGALAGSVAFADGEVQKSISFSIVDDNLVEEDEIFTVTLSGPTGVALGAPATTTVTILDNDLPIVPNATPAPERLQQASSGFGKSDEHYVDFVTKAYVRFLNRMPEAQGVQYWVDLMKRYESSHHQQGLRQEQIEAGFLNSNEYLSRYGGTTGATWIRGIYHDLLNRDPGLAETQYWLNQLLAGVQPTDVALGFTSSDERLRSRVTDTYFTLLGRVPETSGLNYWVALFKAGGTTEDINSGFVGSTEYYNKPDGAAGNPARWVREAYLDILFRPARTEELSYWLKLLSP